MRAIPPRRLSAPRGGWQDVEWLLANIGHGAAVRPAERAAWIETARLSSARPRTTALADCGNSPANR
ncbi:MAG: hypothetical protein VCD66_09535 [Alphaproteobacteria bacterium]|jgi:hypothetical protein